MKNGLQIVDGRAPSEWEEGHIPGAVHIFLPELREKAAELSPRKPVALYCDSGYRASLAASILKQEGFENVRDLPDNEEKWKKIPDP